MTYSDGFDGLPVPSPDGKTLAWTSSRAGGSRRTAVPRPVEPREGARSAEERAAAESRQEIMTRARCTARPLSLRCSSAIWRARGCFVGSVRSAQTPRRPAPHVETLASPRLEGRLAGSNGERLASDYLVAELQKIGAKPLPGQKDFRLPFEFTAGTRDGGSTRRRSGAPTAAVSRAAQARRCGRSRFRTTAM